MQIPKKMRQNEVYMSSRAQQKMQRKGLRFQRGNRQLTGSQESVKQFLLGNQKQWNKKESNEQIFALNLPAFCT